MQRTNRIFDPHTGEILDNNVVVYRNHTEQTQQVNIQTPLDSHKSIHFKSEGAPLHMQYYIRSENAMIPERYPPSISRTYLFSLCRLQLGTNLLLEHPFADVNQGDRINFRVPLAGYLTIQRAFGCNERQAKSLISEAEKADILVRSYNKNGTVRFRFNPDLAGARNSVKRP